MSGRRQNHCAPRATNATPLARRNAAIGCALVGYWVLGCPASASTVTCVDCHEDAAKQMATSVHAAIGADCVLCHGGAAEYATPVNALPFDHGADFLGTPNDREAVAQCSKCHEDVTQMNPYGLRTDSVARYRSSKHGQALLDSGDDRSASCIDCHGAHGVLSASTPTSPTYAANVPDMCGRCHADEALMDEYGLPAEIPAEYKASVHGQALLVRGDLSAPTCAVCHDAHASMPPGFESVHGVCGQCHQQEEEYFLQSPHAKMFTFPGCIACHGGKYGHGISRVYVDPDDMVDAARRLLRAGKSGVDIEALHPQLSLMGEACMECHDPDTEDDIDAIATARAKTLYASLSGAEKQYVEAALRVRAARRGVIPARSELQQLSEARTSLVGMAPRQHTLNAALVQEQAQAVERMLGAIDASLSEKHARLMIRYWMLIPFWALILVLAYALYAKHRQLRRQWAAQHGGATK